MTRRPIAVALAVLLTAAAAGPAVAAPSEKTFRKRALAVCERGNAAVQKDLVAFLGKHPDLAPDPGRNAAQRALRASLLATVASERARANRRLARVQAPKRLRSRYARFVRLERTTNVTLPRRTVRLLRQPGSAGNDAALRKAARQNQRASTAFGAASSRLGLGRCVG